MLNELDTISDFIAYLNHKESYFTAEAANLGAEEDLLAIYLRNSRALPIGLPHIMADGSIWEAFNQEPGYKNKCKADEISYVWDDIIELISADHANKHLEPDMPLCDIENALRVLARENRFSRRILGKSYFEFRNDASNGKTRARATESPSNTTYMFMRGLVDEPLDFLKMELDLRCRVARDRFRNNSIVIGILVLES